jgi:hypothetical protein
LQAASRPRHKQKKKESHKKQKLAGQAGQELHEEKVTGLRTEHGQDIRTF